MKTLLFCKVFLFVDDGDTRNCKNIIIDTRQIEGLAFISQSRKKVKPTSKRKEVKNMIAHCFSYKVKDTEKME